MKRVDALIADYPNFRLAYLVRGDLLLARTRPLEGFGNVVKTVPQERVEDLRDEALARLRAQRDKPGDDWLPRYVMQLNPEQKHALVVDSRRSRLYVFANAGGKPKLVADYYVTLGKKGVDKTREGDQKTPLGVYYVVANCRAASSPTSTAPALSRSITRTSGTGARDATAMASGCTACRRTCTAGRRARAMAASCSPIRISTPSATSCRSASRR